MLNGIPIKLNKKGAHGPYLLKKNIISFQEIYGNALSRAATYRAKSGYIPSLKPVFRSYTDYIFPFYFGFRGSLNRGSLLLIFAENVLSTLTVLQRYKIYK
jgi:hypothetical protein